MDAKKKERKWYSLNLFGLEIKPIYGIIIGLFLIYFTGGILNAVGTILFVSGIITLIAEMIRKKKKK